MKCSQTLLAPSSMPFLLSPSPPPNCLMSVDDVRGDAHHQWGRGARWARQQWSTGLRLPAAVWLRGSLWVADGVHAGGAGSSPGDSEGVSGEPGPDAGQAARSEPRKRLSAETTQHGFATGKPESTSFLFSLKHSDRAGWLWSIRWDDGASCNLISRSDSRQVCDVGLLIVLDRWTLCRLQFPFTLDYIKSITS